MFVKYIGIPDLTVTVDEGPILCVTDEVIEISNADYNVLRQRYPGDFVTEEHGSNPVDSDVNVTTYTDLFTNITNSTLIPGATYELPFETIWLPRNLVVDDVNVETGATETIRVIAATNNTLLEQAQSVTFPEDSIWYDITSKVVGTSINTKGTIYKRVNNPRNIECIPVDGDTTKSNDFRAVKSPFWMFDKSEVNGLGLEYASPYGTTQTRNYAPSGFGIGTPTWSAVIQTVTIVDVNDYVLKNIFNDDLSNKKNVTVYGNLESKSVNTPGLIRDTVIPAGTTDLYVKQGLNNNDLGPAMIFNGLHDGFSNNKFLSGSNIDLRSMAESASGLYGSTGADCTLTDSFIRGSSLCDFGSAYISNCNIIGQLQGVNFLGKLPSGLSGVQSLGASGIRNSSFSGKQIKNANFAGNIDGLHINNEAGGSSFRDITASDDWVNVDINLGENDAVFGFYTGALEDCVIGRGCGIDGLTLNGACLSTSFSGSFISTSFNALDRVTFDNGASGTVLGDIIDTTFHGTCTALSIAATKKIEKCLFQQDISTFSITENFTNNNVQGKVTSIALTAAHDSKLIMTDTAGALIEHSVTALSPTYSTVT